MLGKRSRIDDNESKSDQQADLSFPLSLGIFPNKRGSDYLKTDRDKFPINDSIQCYNLKATENLCLIVSLYNSLRTFEERLAFSGGNLSQPINYFLEFCKSHPRFDKNRKKIPRVRYGYDENDLRHYFRFLKTENLISDWKINRMESKQIITHLLFSPTVREPNTKYLIFGCAGSTDARDKIIHRCRGKNLKSNDDKTWFKNLNPRARLEYEASMLMQFNNHEKCRNSSHAITVGFDSDGQPYIYDNARHTRRPVYDVEVFVNSLVYYWRWYIFSITPIA